MRAEAADVLASVCEAAAAGVGHLVTAHRALVAGDLDDLNHIGIVACRRPLRSSSRSAKDRALLVYAAAHRRSVSRHDRRRYIKQVIEQCVVPRQLCDLAQDLVFQMLYLGIEFSHLLSPSRRRAAAKVKRLCAYRNSLP